MSQEAPAKSIGAAIEDAAGEMQEEEKDPGTEVASPDDDTSVDEGVAEGEEEEATEEEGEVPDLEDDDGWAKSPDDEDEEEGEGEEEGGEGEEEGEEEPVAAASVEEEEIDLFETLTPEQIEKVNSSPELKILRKALMRGYNQKMAGKAQLLQLEENYKNDPVGVAMAFAEANGLKVTRPEPPAAGETAQGEALDKIAQARQDVSELFGDKVGPEVTEKFEKLFNVLTESVVAPLTNQVGTITAQSEQARMLSEEAAWRQRNKEILTPDVEKSVVALGNSGKFVPGDQAPSEYLDSLLKLVLADKVEGRVATAKAGSSKKLAKRIEKNRRDREPTGVGSKAGVKKVSRLKTQPEKFNVSSALDEAARELHDGG